MADKVIPNLDDLRREMILEDYGSDEEPGQIILCRGPGSCAFWNEREDCDWCMRIYAADPRTEAQLLQAFKGH